MDLNTWPINSPMFDAVYGLAYLLSLLAALALQMVVGDALEGEPRAPSSLRIGELPKLGDTLLFAYATSSLRLRNTLLAAGIAEGWLAADAHGFRVLPDATPRPELRPLHDEIARTKAPLDRVKVLAAAACAGRRIALDRHFDDVLARTGMRRSGLARVATGAVFVVFAVALMSFAFARATYLDQGFDYKPAQTIFLPAILLLLAPFAGREARRGREYRKWLAEHTEALVQDVLGGARNSVDDVALACAVRDFAFMTKPLPIGLRALTSLLGPRTGVST